MFNNATYGGTVDVHAQTGVLLESGASHYNRAQIGHGGYAAGNGAGNTVEMVNAAITVDTVSGGVVLDATKAANRGHAAAQIGHGGTGYYNAVRAGAFRGDITVSGGTGNVEIHGGSRAGSSAMIGNGGTGLSGDHSGKIEVMADGDLTMDVVAGGTANRFSRIGHGGIGSDLYGADLAMSGNMSGEICVTVGGKATLDGPASASQDAYLQIGHGGTAVTGDFDGDITLVARGADGISLTGGAADGTYSQVGHGGINTAGTMSGDIRVVAETGATQLQGGIGTNAYAMIGHGDGAKTSTGQRKGGVHLFSEGQLVGTNGTGAGSNVYVFHQNNNGLQTADYLGGDGFQMVANGGVSLPDSALVDISTMISGNFASGLMSIALTNDIDITVDAGNDSYGNNTANDFYILTGGNITMLSGYQNSGSGDVTLVAGWDGVGATFNGSVTYTGGIFCDPVINEGDATFAFNNCDFFGGPGNDKTLTIGSATQDTRVSVGSAGGTNTFAAAGIELFGGDMANAATQLGLYSDGTAASGKIDVHVKDLGLTLTSGVGNGAFTQIGHGGMLSNPVGGVNAAIDISFCAPGDILLKAHDTATNSYSQIGHGGNNWDGAKVGAISIDGARDITLDAGARDAGAQIGHGGQGVTDAYGTGIANGQIDVLGTTGKVTLLGGGGLNAVAQIGHGGVALRGTMDGDVNVEAGTGGIQMTGGGGTRSYTMIGHGGYNVDRQLDGNVCVTTKGTVATDGIVMSGGNGDYSGSHIGNGIYFNTATINGNTTVDVTNGGIRMTGGTAQYANVGLGHTNNNDTATMNGFTDVDIASGDLIMAGGTGNYTAATIGHEKIGGNATINGYVAVDVVKGDIDLTGGDGQYANATIGHAGRGGTSTSTGQIDVVANDGNISLKGNDTATGYFSHARIGHGGWESGNKVGAINVTADTGDILVRGGLGNTTSARYNFAQIGHGGYGNGATQNVDAIVNVTATDGSVTVQAGTANANFAQIGNGGLGRSSLFLGSFGGDVTVKTGDAIDVLGGTQDYAHAMIGNGGSGVQAPLSGNVLVEAGDGGIDLQGGAEDYTYALIGNGSYDADNDIGGTTTVRALGTNTATDGIRLKGGNGNQSVAQIGHHHSYGPGNLSGAVNVSAAAGDIKVEAGDTGYFAHAMIGHGGRDSNGDKSGIVTVTADDGDIVLRAGGASASDRYAHAQIGHGGYANGVVDRKYSDAVNVEAKSGSISLTGGDAKYDYAQIGHGGTSAGTGMSVEFSGVVDVKASEDITLQGRNSGNSLCTDRTRRQKDQWGGPFLCRWSGGCLRD